MKLVTEADALRALKGTYTLGQLYALCLQLVDVSRDGGYDLVPGHAGDLRWHHRLRGDLETLRRAGQGDRIGKATWAIQGTPLHPRRMLLIVAGGNPLEFEIRLQSAVELLGDLDSPADLVLCDPPYALGRGRGHYADGHGYRRDSSKIVPGYVDVDPAGYPEFTRDWVQAAAAALRPGGQLAVVTGPQRAAIVQCAAEAAGLTWVTSIAAYHEFPTASLRRPSPAHWTITIMARGPLDSPRRVFNPPADLPAARSGHPYPLDWWPYNGRADRPGLLRYDNSLPLRMVIRLILALTNRGDHVVDPCLGGGTSAIGSFLTGRKFTGGDVNPGALTFTAARLLVEHAWPADIQPALFPVYL